LAGTTFLNEPTIGIGKVKAQSDARQGDIKPRYACPKISRSMIGRRDKEEETVIRIFRIPIRIYGEPS
jgi:hypothetical protein